MGQNNLLVLGKVNPALHWCFIEDQIYNKLCQANTILQQQYHIYKN